MLTLHFRQPTTANICLSFVTTRASISSHFFSFTPERFPARNMSFEIFPLFCILFLCTALLARDIFLQNSRWHFFHDTLCKYYQRISFVQDSEALTTSLYDYTTHGKGLALHSSADKMSATWAESIALVGIRFAPAGRGTII